MQRSDYIIRRLGWALFTIIFVVVLNFFMFRVLPGDPAKAGIRDPVVYDHSGCAGAARHPRALWA